MKTTIMFLVAVLMLVGCNGAIDNCDTICDVGKPCGDSCISREYECYERAGTACDEDGNPGNSDINCPPDCECDASGDNMICGF